MEFGPNCMIEVSNLDTQIQVIFTWIMQPVPDHFAEWLANESQWITGQFRASGIPEPKVELQLDPLVKVTGSWVAIRIRKLWWGHHTHLQRSRALMKLRAAGHSQPPNQDWTLYTYLLFCDRFAETLWDRYRSMQKETISAERETDHVGGY